MNATQAGNGEVLTATRTGKVRRRVLMSLETQWVSIRLEYRKKCVVLRANRDWACRLQYGIP